MTYWSICRKVLRQLSLATVAWSLGISLIASPAVAAEPTGQAVEGMGELDAVMQALIEKWALPGASLAVVKDGRLVFARGYGLADVEQGAAVQPDSLFRIASLSKPVTATAVMKLVDEGRLSLDDRAFTILADYTPPGGTFGDARLEQITVRQLLQHTGGWDRDEGGDPMFQPATRTVSTAFGIEHPPTCAHVIRYMAGQTLEFDPGSRYGYSNLGYCILGRIIERVSGEPYEGFVQRSVLEPAGATAMRQGRTRLAERSPGEVRYYTYAGVSNVRSVFADGGMVPPPDGGFSLEMHDANGGWLATPTDYLRFLNAIDGRRGAPLLTTASLAELIARPPEPAWPGSPSYYGLGWLIRPVAAGANWWHAGSLPGTTGYAVRLADGISWVLLANSRPQAYPDMQREIDQSINAAVRRVREWPSHDLFGSNRAETEAAYGSTS